jgi:hypothetical protein
VSANVSDAHIVSDNEAFAYNDIAYSGWVYGHDNIGHGHDNIGRRSMARGHGSTA